MYSLFKIKYNWGVYLLLLFTIRLVWIDISWLSFIALAITINQFMLLFNSIGSIIPIRYLAGSLMCVQLLLGPTFAFNGLDEYQYITYKMKIPQTDYFLYVIPAVVCFIVGLHITAGKLKGEVLDREAIRRFVDKSGNTAYIFIGVGFLSSLVASFFSAELAFIFILLGNFKFVGLFMLLLGTKKLKILPIVVVMGSIVLDALSIAMFHDLLTWILLLGSVLAIKYRVKFVFKAIAATSFILLSVIIQQLKKDYRASATIEGTGVESFEKVYRDKQESNSLFSFEKLAESNVRINQGFIITNIMRTVPDKVPYEDGKEMLQILEAAIFPRILAPNKLNAGDRVIFMKYTGMILAAGTSMGLSSVGDAYINFGPIGGCIFMFFYGLFFSEVLNGFKKNSVRYPILYLFIPLVFYYPIRADCELQTILGHIIKCCFLIFMVIQIWKATFHARWKRNSIETANLKTSVEH